MLRLVGDPETAALFQRREAGGCEPIVNFPRKQACVGVRRTYGDLMASVRSTRAFSSAGMADFQVGSVSELVRVTRSGQVESIHLGALVVVDATGQLLAAVGDPEVPVYWRSAAKPHQALALLQEKGVSALGLEDEHLAILSASHHASEEQLLRVREVLAKSGHRASDLRCGVHAPVSQSLLQEMARKGQSPTPLHNMCSGNHAGLLCLSKLLGADRTQYDRLEDPTQQQLLRLVSRFTDLPAEEIQTGVDGCGIPTYRTPLWRLAMAYARLAHPAGLPPQLAGAADRLFTALNAAPQLLSAEGELDAEFIRAFRGSALCKLGAGGLVAAGLKASPRSPNGVGIALKVADGLGDRARGVALVAALEHLNLGTSGNRESLRAQVPHEILNNRGEGVGTIEAAFDLRSFPEGSPLRRNAAFSTAGRTG